MTRFYTCAVCGHSKPTTAYARHAASRRRMAYCRDCTDTPEAAAFRQEANYRKPKTDMSILGK